MAKIKFYETELEIAISLVIFHETPERETLALSCLKQNTKFQHGNNFFI